MNNQKPEPHAKGDGEILDVHSVFLTLQGEGPNTGRRCVFLRLAGCNLQCPGCDTEYTAGRRTLTRPEIIEAIREQAAPMADSLGLIYDGLVVITGGEPLRQPIGHLVANLINIGYNVQIESNGMFAPDERLAAELSFRTRRELCLVISPKTSKIHRDAAKHACVFKYVLDWRHVDKEDGLPSMALDHTVLANSRVARPPAGSMAKVYVTPRDEGNETDNYLNLVNVGKSCLKHGYIAGVQLHKFLNLP